jgi:hypothetical protein
VCIQYTDPADTECRDHLARRGIFASQLMVSLQDNELISKALDGNNAKSVYLPFGRPYANMPPGQQVRELADYVDERIRAAVRRRAFSNRSGMTTANRNIHPTLISENESRKRSARINPTVLQQNPVQADHLIGVIDKRRRSRYGRVSSDIPN